MTLEATPVGRHGRRRRENRRRILLAAMELFTERGIDAVTVEEIAERADVARGTVFNHFSTKEILCQCMGELQVEMLEEAVKDGRIAGPSAGEKIAQAMRLMAEFPGRNAEQCRALLTRILASMTPGELPEHRLQVFAMFESWVVEGQQSGEFRSDVPPCELAGFMMGLHFQATLLWAYGFAHGPLADYLTRSLQLALEGIRVTR
jgi:AcrR family transcriptional regulator